MKQKDELVGTLKDDIVALTERFHKIKRNEMRLRVNANKIRLGEYYTDKKGK